LLEVAVAVVLAHSVQEQVVVEVVAIDHLFQENLLVVAAAQNLRYPLPEELHTQ
jgi:hypothetical protein